ncbi:AfsR/SARP family transcriptional regulator [Streptomyces tagetis]|uniref:AfsR/SARP family transcriptional regulator n=1 Tax=Streptomyces tagetis TaxID=2820809 RepID=A0A940XI95_9ACTN|nr:AfsR/SARP family transcriptional regulator [Streptomyces sp. RG38]
MDIRVLGPLILRTSRDGNLIEHLTAPKPRKIIALLALQANHVVTTASMARELWGDNPPASMQTTLQTYVLQVRKLLGRALRCTSSEVASSTLVTKFGGYQLNLRPGEVDIDEFDQLAAEGRKVVADGADEEAVRLLTRAMEVWSGPPLVDMQVGPLLDAEIRRLEENRLTVLMQRNDAKIRLALHHELPGELAGVVSQYAMHENLHAQYMLSLYRSGRCSDALVAFRRLREHMVGELGLEPSLKLQRLHRAMLTADPALDCTEFTGIDSLLERFQEAPVLAAHRRAG